MSLTGLIFAHRGITTGAHENTLDAFQAAIDAGADGIELDVHATRDGRLVVHHDDAVGGALLAAITGDAARQRAKAAGYEMPELADVIDLVRGRVRIDVELKGRGFEQAVVDLLADQGLTAADVIVTSFDAHVIKTVLDIDADVLTGWLVKGHSREQAIDTYFECGADVLAPRHDMVNHLFLEEAQREEVALLPWCVNNPALMQQLLASPAVLGFITDRVEEAVRVRRAAGH